MMTPSTNPTMNPQTAPIMLPKNVGAYPMYIEDINSTKGLPTSKTQDINPNKNIKIAATAPIARPKLRIFKWCFSFILLTPSYLK